MLVFGRDHVLLHGHSRSHFVRDFRAPLSIKSVLRGTAEWRTDDSSYTLRPGNYLVLNNRHAYSMEMDLPQPGETFCVFFRDGWLEDIAQVRATAPADLLDGRDHEPHEFIEVVQQDAAVSACLEQLRIHRENQGELLVALSEEIVRADERLHAVEHRVGAIKASTRAELLRRLLRARDFVESSLGGSLSLEKVARAAALSPYHLHRTFRRAFGETIHAYITRRRLERAADLLQRTGLTILEISAAVGFDSPTSFSTLFRRTYGVSPRQFRNSQDSRGLAATGALRSAS